MGRPPTLSFGFYAIAHKLANSSWVKKKVVFMRHRHEWDEARSIEKGETYVYICMLFVAW